MFKKIINHKDNSVYLNLIPCSEILNKIKMISFKNQTDAMLRNYSEELICRARSGNSLDKLLIEAFALVNEVIYRVLQINAFDVQIIAGIELYNCKLIEMQTGEGKTLAAVFPAYLNALTGDGVHILTFNDYLAFRDANWMGPIFEFLGLSVGFVQEGMGKQERKKAYACDITYVTAKEAGFDYLRDSLSYEVNELVHRPFNYAIVDEADSIMIDEARIPLVLAASINEETDSPQYIVNIIRQLQVGLDFNTDDSSRNIYLTDKGIKHVEDILHCGNLYEADNFKLLTEIHSALHAEILLKRDVDYLVKGEKIELIDEFTGRIAENRHWPDGLQAAIEAKEGLNSDSKGRIMSSITIQSFIKLYPKISGMTGTAVSSYVEFLGLYDLETIVIPSNQPCIRVDYPDLIFSHKEAKYDALLNEIRNINETGRPILIGTSSITESEYIAAMLNESGVHCQVLNAKNDELEAQIIANAGALGAVTVSTNMAGRGTDIKLGGSIQQDREQVITLGGLYVIGTNRHESVRIDNQLRGRAGRQGDPGSSRFYISLEDDIFKKYGIERLIPKKHFPAKQSGPINTPRVLQGVAQVQRVIEGQNIDIRTTLWKYSNIIEIQRMYIFNNRKSVLFGKTDHDLFQLIEPDLYSFIKTKIGVNKLSELLKNLTLHCIDQCWADYLDQIAYLREGIHLVIIGGQNPLETYLSNVVQLFEELKEQIESSITNAFRNIKISEEGIDIGINDIKGPSSTWTYLINDNPFADDLGLMLASSRNIGFSSVAALVPIISISMIISLIYQRFFKKGKLIE